MKIYISLPITGQDIEQVEASCIFAKGVIEKKGHEAVSPLDIQPDPDAPYNELMGNCIKHLLACDAAVFLDGWNKSKGCFVEFACANEYGITTFFDVSYIPEAENLPSHE